MQTRKAIYAGSFDPLTNGHLWVIKRCIRLFDSLTIAIGENPNKTYFLDTELRKRCILKALSSLGKFDCDVQVQIIGNEFLATYAEKHDVPCLIRGIRSESDFSYEYAMTIVNREINSDLDTIYLMPPPDLAQVSSSLVKSMLGPEGWESLVQKYVPPETLKVLTERVAQ